MREYRHEGAIETEASVGGVGQEVKRLREARGWIQAKLAVEAGMAPSAVNQIENGKRSPSANSLNKLAGALGVEVAELFPKGQASLPDFEDERRPSLQSWIAFVGRLADRWGAEISEREQEWQASAPHIRRNVKHVPNLHWANELRATAVDVMVTTNEELEMVLGVATSAEALELFAAVRRLNQVVSRTDAWYPAAAGDVIDLREHFERIRRRVGARAS